MTTTTAASTLAALRTEHAASRRRYHAIEAELAALMDANAKGEVAEDAAWYAAVDALVAEQAKVSAAEEAMRHQIHRLTREQYEADLGIDIEGESHEKIIRVSKLNVAALERALDYGGDQYETDQGETVTLARTYVEGTASALAALAGAATEMAEVNITEIASECWETSIHTPFAEAVLRRSIEAAHRAANRIYRTIG